MELENENKIFLRRYLVSSGDKWDNWFEYDWGIIPPHNVPLASSRLGYFFPPSWMYCI